jgi:hypothetical protein
MKRKIILLAVLCGSFSLGSAFAADAPAPAKSPEADRPLQAA